LQKTHEFKCTNKDKPKGIKEKKKLKPFSKFAEANKLSKVGETAS